MQKGGFFQPQLGYFSCSSAGYCLLYDLILTAILFVLAHSCHADKEQNSTNIHELLHVLTMYANNGGTEPIFLPIIPII